MDLFLPQPSEKKTKKRTQKNDLCVELLMFIDLVFVHCHICIGLYVYISWHGHRLILVSLNRCKCLHVVSVVT
jgi:hypothetical protein